MKYSEYTSKPKFKGSAAFYTVIACCLLALGGASWFAASRISRRSSDGNNSPSQIPDSPQSSAAESISEPQATVSENVGKSVSDEPYSSKSDAAEPKTESKLPKKVFTIPVQGDIIKKYSDKELQFSATYGDMRRHTGLDIACADGTAVSACSLTRLTNQLSTMLYSACTSMDAMMGRDISQISFVMGITPSLFSSCKGITLFSSDSVSAVHCTMAPGKREPPGCAFSTHSGGVFWPKRANLFHRRKQFRRCDMPGTPSPTSHCRGGRPCPPLPLTPAPS